MELKNAVVAITGGGQGLGRAMTLHLAKLGADIAILDLNQERMDETLAMAREHGVKAKSYFCNVTDETQVEQTFSQVINDFGKINGLVNNAGILRDGLLVKAKEGKVVKKLSLEHWQAVIDVNLTAVFLCTREVVSHMIENNCKGCIINISSISRAGNIGQTNYTAAKAGVAGMTVTWAKELARYGIRSMAIAPGFMETEMTASMPPEAYERFKNTIPLKHLGNPDDIAQTVAFIMQNDYLSGRVIEVDGALRL